MLQQRRIIGVIGASEADEPVRAASEKVGRLIARSGSLLVCGGLGGVMEAAAKGASLEGGTVIGILPQGDRSAANAHITIPVATGLGEGRNMVIVRTADALIAIGGEYGTLSEIALALRLGRPVIGLGSWNIKGMLMAVSEEEAVRSALRLAGVREEG